MAYQNTQTGHESASEPRQENALSIPLEAYQTRRASYFWERKLLQKLLEFAGSPPIQCELWDGSQVRLDNTSPRFTLGLTDPKALYHLVSNPNLSFGDLYSAGRLTVSGDLTELLDTLYQATRQAESSWPAWLEKLWANHAPRSTDMGDARQNIHHHYDLGNDFYRLWLDTAEMQYTCAYFESADNTLEQAQLAKLEHVCRKLQLKPGMTVVEAGCGWGGLARYMARNYGVNVHAYNISKEQLAFAREEAKRQGLDQQIDYVEDDYRNISGQYDAFVSVGMLEHVGTSHYDDMATVIKRSLKPDGLALLHSIGRNSPRKMNAWIEKRIFPGAYPPSIGEFVGICERGNFSVLDVENLRLHYAQTLEHWKDRFEAHVDEVTDMYDENFTRAWRLYLAGSISAFRTSSLQLFQVVFSHADNNSVPRNRKHLYASSAAPESV
ncbi:MULTISPECIES: SAM-dependent methyltransferase [Marinobacter]|uniref:SAM-dependent methyltransferase n=1 Tax=Marinobacter TaxID=2742 RepID=UPI000DAC36E5|nr:MULTISPECIES: cyclopropane-fatty-acyl-phospholipid synthase family protein [Marinobacter]